jgi:hypothetical protein
MITAAEGETRLTPPAAGAEIAAATTATRSGIIFRLAHGLRFAEGHSAAIGSEAAIKNGDLRGNLLRGHPKVG